MSKSATRTAAAIGFTAVTLFSTALTGCRSTPTIDDTTLTAQVQQRLAGDAAISSEPVQVIAQGGVVTLSGSTSNNAARSLAADDTARVTGVQKVINNIVVNPSTGPASALSTTPLQQAPTVAVPPPRERIKPSSVRPEPAPVTRTSTPPQAAYTPRQPAAAPQPSIPPPPVARVVTLPSGSTLPVRITQTLDSGSSQPGDSFSGAVATDIIADNMLLIPRGSSVNGRVTEVHEAAHFKGSSLLTIELVGVNTHGERISVSTQPYSVEGKGRGKNTAVKTGVGAAAGAVLGGIFGGGKGAAIGAAAGGGTGAAINGVTRGEQVQIPSESVVRFVTTNSIAVRTATHAGSNGSDPALQSRY